MRYTTLCLAPMPLGAIGYLLQNPNLPFKGFFVRTKYGHFYIESGIVVTPVLEYIYHLLS